MCCSLYVGCDAKSIGTDLHMLKGAGGGALAARERARPTCRMRNARNSRQQKIVAYSRGRDWQPKTDCLTRPITGHKGVYERETVLGMVWSRMWVSVYGSV